LEFPDEPEDEPEEPDEPEEEFPSPEEEDLDDSAGAALDVLAAGAAWAGSLRRPLFKGGCEEDGAKMRRSE